MLIRMWVFTFCRTSEYNPCDQQKGTDGRTDGLIDRHKDEHTGRQTDSQINRPGGSKINRQGGRQTDRQKNKQTSRWTGGLADRSRC